MKYKTVETVPFKTTYMLVSRYHKKQYGPFDSITEVKVFHRTLNWWYNPFIDKVELTEKEQRHFNFLKSILRVEEVYRLEHQYCITDLYGNVIPIAEVNAAAGGRTYRNHNWEVRELKWDQTVQRLVKVKGDGKKIKKDWAYTNNGGYGFGRYCEYANRAVGSIRYVRTQAERRASAAHDADYGQGLVRAARRGRHLPHSWDDPRCGMYDLQICWKHSTKRRKQWIPK
ncbi:hypothetical protein Xoosp13_106 [Xanthomonas phage Xoo-sp13]|nr:hypothetical protein Xoosp13_106 [Xanthomonas phage Xoo-sp13]